MSAFTKTCLGVASLSFLLGCASLDPSSVERAQVAVAAAKADQRIDPTRSIHLQEAERHLALAQETLDAGGSQQTVDQEAYLAETNAKIARANGAAQQADEASSALLDRAQRQAADTREVVETAVRRARALQARQTERGIVLTLGGVLFGFDSAALKPEAKQSAARVAGYLIALDDRDVLIEGHTDDTGTEAYNLELSLKRAESVRQELIANGVDGSRIVADGFGPGYPVAPNASEEGRAKNRRVEIIILDPGTAAADARRGG